MLSLAVLLALAAPSAQAPTETAGNASAARAAALPVDVAATGRETSLSFRELDALLLERHGRTQEGREALVHLVKSRVLEELALESQLEVTEADVDERIRELQREMLASGEKDDFASYLRKKNVDLATFRLYLRLGIVQETLARRALGIPPDRPVSREQQEMWLEQVMQGRGLELEVGGAAGVAARCGSVQITADEFAAHLRLQLPREAVLEDCYQLLLEKRVRARMPDLAPQALQRAVELELARRKHEFESDPAKKGLTYEQMIGASGMNPQSMHTDPSVIIGALVALWIDRKYGADGLKRAYEAERAHFDGRYGEAYDVTVLFLRAAVFQNQLNPRSFEDAEKHLGLLKSQIRSLADLQRLAVQQSEEPQSRARQGSVGWIARGDERISPELAVEVFRRADASRLTDAQRLIGPVRTQGGALLAWIGAKREPPPWEQMAFDVQRELKKRFLDEVLKKEEVVTFLDADQ